LYWRNFSESTSDYSTTFGASRRTSGSIAPL
jgi:hypothetical protein